MRYRFRCPGWCIYKGMHTKFLHLLKMLRYIWLTRNSVRNCCLRNSAKLTEKHLCQFLRTPLLTEHLRSTTSDKQCSDVFKGNKGSTGLKNIRALFKTLQTRVLRLLESGWLSEISVNCFVTFSKFYHVSLANLSLKGSMELNSLQNWTYYFIWYQVNKLVS